jgi:hypothetical protein
MDADDRIQQTMERMRGGGGYLKKRLPEWFPGIAEDEVQYIISRLREELLIGDDEGPEIYRLTGKGRDVVDSTGGWLNYKRRNEVDRDLDRKIKKSVLGINSITKWGLILTAFFTLATLVFTYLDYRNGKSSLEVDRQMLDVEQRRDSVELLERDSIQGLTPTTPKDSSK